MLALLSLSTIGNNAFASSSHESSEHNENSDVKHFDDDKNNHENNCEENDNGNTQTAPSGSVLVLNIKHKVTNDEDSGNVGYWALDNYERHVKVWRTSDGNFYVVTEYEGTWQTFTDALSPGIGATESKNASGCIVGGYVGTFSGTFTPGSHKTYGDIGTFDYGGTKSDILLGTYGAGQVGSTTPFSYLNTYFTGVGSSFNYIHWGWDYHFGHQLWHNFDTGTTGDIVV